MKIVGTVCAAIVLLVSSFCAARDIVVEKLPPDRLPQEIDRVPFTSYQESLSRLQFALLKTRFPDGWPRVCADAFEALSRGDEDLGEQRLLELMAQDENEGFAQLAGYVYGMLLKNQERYRELAALDPNDEATRTLGALPTGSLTTAATPVSDFLDRERLGIPEVEVQINGRREIFFFDTGMDRTMLSASKARKYGVRILDGALDVRAGTSIASQTRFGVVDSLKVGNLVFRDHTVMVVPDENIPTVTLADGSTFRIDQGLGWNAIMKGRAVLDFPHGTFRFTASTPDRTGEPDFFWIEFPLVHLVAENGQTLLFGLDTGSVATSLLKPVLDRLDFPDLETKPLKSTSVGGAASYTGFVVPRFAFILDDYLVSLPDVAEDNCTVSEFVQVDGILGSDVLRDFTVTIDYPDHRFAISRTTADGEPDWPEVFGYAPSEVATIEIGDYGFPFIPVTIGDVAVKLPFDTGNMVGVSVNEELYDGLELTTLRTYDRLDGAGRRVGTLRVGEARQVVALGRDVGRKTIYEIDDETLPGLFGPADLGASHFTLDYRTRRLAAGSSRLPREIPGYRAVPLVRSERNPTLILVRGSVAGREIVIELDTGKSRTVVNPDLAAELGLEPARHGVRIDSLRIGELTFAVPSAKEVDQTDIDAGLPDPILAGVGSDILSRFVWTVDYASGTLWMPAGP